MKPAFSAPFPVPLIENPLSTRTHLTKRRKRPTAATRRAVRTHPRALARNRIDPKDEAFITCTSCGSDSPLSATKILQQGAFAVRCTQCKKTFTALAEEALTATGSRLTDATSRGAEEEENVGKTNMVKLYISGLSPKTDSVSLKKALEEFGEVVSAKVVYDCVTGRSRGFGFVTIVGKSAANAAMDVLSGDSSRFGRRLNVREAVDPLR